MSDHKVIKHPGGVILHLKDGSSEHFEYGRRVNPDDLADYQKANLHHFADDKDRSAYVQTPQVEQDAHRHAALADAGQPNSTSDPVPGNYGELSEEEASQLVLSCQSEPAVQARILLHERLHGGSRQMVIDAGSDEGTEIAETLYDAVQDGVARFDQTRATDDDRPRDNEREVEKKSRSARRSSGSKNAPPPNGS